MNAPGKRVQRSHDIGDGLITVLFFPPGRGRQDLFREPSARKNSHRPSCPGIGCDRTYNLTGVPLALIVQSE
jgi:hypothetical protein